MRTPVKKSTREPVPVEKPKREPVSASQAMSEQHEESVKVEERIAQQEFPEQFVQRTPVPAIDEDGYRVCAREGCDNDFKPKSRNPVHDDVTEFYCSTDCALQAFWKKNMGGGPVPKRVVSASSAAGKRATARALKNGVEDVVDGGGGMQQPPNVDRSAREDERLKKYGPKREIVSIVKTGANSTRVMFECKHEGAYGGKLTSLAGETRYGRCRKCREKIGVEAEKPKRTQRTPVGHEDSVLAHATVHSTKRTPVTQEKTPVHAKRTPATRKTVKPVKRTPVKKSKRRPVK